MANGANGVKTTIAGIVIAGIILSGLGWVYSTAGTAKDLSRQNSEKICSLEERETILREYIKEIRDDLRDVRRKVDRLNEYLLPPHLE